MNVKSKLRKFRCKLDCSLIGLLFTCELVSYGPCHADESEEKAEKMKVPTAPITLLITAAKLHRDNIWTKEVGSEAELEQIVREYVAGIATDCRFNRGRFSAENTHWLKDLLEWRKIKTSGKSRYGSFASKETHAARAALVEFADKRTVQIIDDAIEKFGPPHHRKFEFWDNRHGDPPPKIPISLNSNKIQT